ncbi:MAG: heparinase [Halobacteriales archaeon]
MADHVYPPADWTAEGIADALREADRSFPVPAYEEEAEWQAIADDDLTAPLAAAIRERAEGLREEPVSPIPPSHYLRWVREDGITQPEIRAPLNERVSALSTLALAECLDREGRYLDPILDRAWALCEGTTWGQSAAVLSEARNAAGLPARVDAADPDERVIPLRTGGVARTLAEVAYLLGDRLHPELSRRIRAEVEERVFEPYEAREDLWWMSPPSNNWNAAINGGTLVLALYLLDVDRAGEIAAKACRNMRHYLAGFDADGCTAEGVGYWNFGFGNYVQAAANLEARTGGAYSLFDVPVVERIAAFPLRVEMSRERFPPFSDSTEENEVAPYLAAYLGERFGIESLGARARTDLRRRDPDGDLGNLHGGLRTLAWCRRVSEEWEEASKAPREYFSGTEWWIARDDPRDPEGLVVAAKGGHNDEPHNHNDCGSFVVHYRGESLLTDTGKPHEGYPADYWEPYEGGSRYDRYVVLHSLGHSVPYLNGEKQAAGREFAATVLGHEEEADRERLALDLAGAYPEAAGVADLRRDLTLERGSPGRVVLDDRARFVDPDRDNEAESVLVSYFPMSEVDGGIAVEGESGTARVTTDAPVAIEQVESPVTASEIHRARFEMPVERETASVRLEVEVSPLNGATETT